jgi:predicted DNA-binding transcriptional regulator
MAKKTPEIQCEIPRQLTVMDAADRVFEEGLLAREDVIHRWIENKCTEYFSYAVTEDHGAIILVIATDKYFHER